MKKLLYGLLMLPCISHAITWSMPNQNGGEIVITDRDCMHDGKSYAPLKEAYSYSEGIYIEGCWTVQDGMIRVIWNLKSGAKSLIYDMKDFTIKNTNKNSNSKPI